MNGEKKMNGKLPFLLLLVLFLFITTSSSSKSSGASRSQLVLFRFELNFDLLNDIDEVMLMLWLLPFVVVEWSLAPLPPPPRLERVGSSLSPPPSTFDSVRVTPSMLKRFLVIICGSTDMCDEALSLSSVWRENER